MLGSRDVWRKQSCCFGRRVERQFNLGEQGVMPWIPEGAGEENYLDRAIPTPPKRPWLASE
jgi:hypothetical protein